MRPFSEKQLRARLVALNDRWPPGYWLYAASGLLNLMRNGSDGRPVMAEIGGVDQAMIIEEYYKIQCDGGDW